MQQKSLSFLILLFLVFFWSCKPQKDFSPEELNIIPKPEKLELRSGSFLFDKNTRFIVENEEQKAIALQLAEKFGQAAGFRPQVDIAEETGKNRIRFVRGDVPDNEGYLLDIDDR